MVEQTSQAVAAPRLKANVVGPWGLAALVVGVTSPAIGLFAMWGPIEATAGPVVPLVFLGAQRVERIDSDPKAGNTAWQPSLPRSFCADCARSTIH